MRLTNNHGEIVMCGDNCKYNYAHCHDNNCPALNEVYDKLAEYERLEEEGKLLKLPVAPGSTIYIIRYQWIDWSYYGHGFDDYDCQGYARDPDERCDSQTICCVDSTKAELVDIIRYMKNNLFGDTVFISKEEAKIKCEYLNKKQ